LTDIFHEVEEDLRRDKLNQLWKRYGTLFMTVAVLVVAATSAVVLWRQYTDNQRNQAANEFNAATDRAVAGDLDGALAGYEAIAARGGEGYPVLALFREVEVRLAKSDLQGAIAVYDRIAGSAADARLKALARIRAAYLVADIESPEVLKNRVAEFTGDDNPWRFPARDLQAWADYRAGRAAEAGEAYAKLATDPAAPAGLKDRAAKLSVYIKGGGALPPPPQRPAAAPAVPATPAAPPPAEATAPDSSDPAAQPAGAQDR
jgi:hypothetical protein